MIEVEDSAKTETSDDGNVWEEYDVTEIVQKFADGTPNYGFFIRNDDYNGNTMRIYVASEFEDSVELRPKLEITYDDEAPITTFGNSPLKNFVSIAENGNNLTFNVNLDKGYNIIVTSLSGKRVKSFSGKGRNSFTIDKSSINTACYLLTFKSDGKLIHTERMMIIK